MNDGQEASGRARKCFSLIRRAVVACMLSLLVAEVAINVYLRHFADPELTWNMGTISQYQQRVGKNFQFSFQTAFGIYPNPQYRSADGDRHNALGFRGEEIGARVPGRMRVVCMGGSTTYDTNVEVYSEAYPARLEANLREQGIDLEVINAGVPAWTTREHVLSYATRIAHLEPELVVVYAGFNDLMFRAVWPAGAVPADYTSPEDLAPPFALQPWYVGVSLVRIPLIFSRTILPPSRVSLWVDPVKCDGIRNVIATVPPLAEPVGFQSRLPDGVDLRMALDANPPIAYARNLKSLVQLAKANGAEVLLVGFTLDWLYLREFAVDGGEGIRAGIEQMNVAMRQVADEQQVPFFDLDPLMPEDRDLWAEGDFIHNSPAGAAFKAECIAAFLKDKVLPPAENGA